MMIIIIVSIVFGIELHASKKPNVYVVNLVEMKF